jgi:hypothetical protein
MAFSLSGEGPRGPRRGAKGSCGTPGTELSALIRGRVDDLVADLVPGSGGIER